LNEKFLNGTAAHKWPFSALNVLMKSNCEQEMKNTR